MVEPKFWNQEDFGTVGTGRESQEWMEKRLALFTEV
jgi:hypothetical protein